MTIVDKNLERAPATKFTVSGLAESCYTTSKCSLVPLLKGEDDHRINDENQRDAEAGVEPAQALLPNDVLHGLDHRQIVVVDLLLADHEVGDHRQRVGDQDVERAREAGGYQRLESVLFE